MGDSAHGSIWIISKYASLPRYGPGSRLYHLGREFRREGHETLLVTSDANHLACYPDTPHLYNYEDVDGIKVCWIRTRKYGKTASAGRVLSWLDFERRLFGMPRAGLPRPDVVIVSSLSLLSVIFGYHLKKVYGARLVFEIRDIWPLTMVAEGGFHPWHPLVLLLGMVERFGYRKADLVVGTMPRLDIHVRETIGRDRPFHCSPLGYPAEWLSDEAPLSEEFLRSHFPAGKVIVGYAGSIGISNALEPLMQCIEQLSSRTDIHFVIVGGGDLKDVYRKRMSGNANVTFAPRIPRDQVQSFLRKCDVLYLSAHDSPVWRFGQSLNKMVDYMMAGKPVIASYSGYPSMLDEADAGSFVRAGDASALCKEIIRYADMSAEEREKTGRRGRDWILSHRSYGQLANEYLRAIGERVSGEMRAPEGSQES